MADKAFFRFRDFPVYKDAREFRKKAKMLSRKFPDSEKYALTQQLWRALDSVLLNIAEGSERYTDKDFSHFLNNSFTSLGEVIACFDLAFDDNYITQTELNNISKDGEALGKQLKAFSAYVRKQK
jgi:four helix bundle protein